MKIAIVATEAIIHSAIARELSRGHRVTVYTRCESAEGRGRSRLAPGVTVESLPAGPPTHLSDSGLLPYISDFSAGLQARWDKERPDVIHAHSWAGGLAAIAGSDGLGVPVTQTFHTLSRGTPEERSRTRLERAIARRADAVIATCADEESELIRLGVPRRSIAVVPGAVDIERFHRHGPAFARGERARMVHVGRLGPDSGVSTAIRALDGVPGAELLVAGGPADCDADADPELHRLRRLAKEVGVEGRVTFLGQVAHSAMPKLMRSADLVLSLPSAAPTGTVVLEAMACGVPVIASASGAHLDSVVDGVTGYLINPARPAELARRARELLADPTLRTALGYAGADRARSRYSVERIGRELVRVYEDARLARCA
jgi:glycosyltransferase involved in cell wall biosynthesis